MKNYTERQYQYFREHLKNLIQVERISSGDGLRKAFVTEMCKHVSEDYADVETLFLKATYDYKPLACDGYLYNSEENTLILVLADMNLFSRERETNFTQKLLSTKVEQLTNLVRFALDGNPDDLNLDPSAPEYGLLRLIRLSEIERFHFLILTDRRFSQQIKGVRIPAIDHRPVDVSCWNLRRIVESRLKGEERELLELDFADTPIPMTFASEGPQYKSYLGVVPGNLLADIYHKYNSRLLEGNVRSFLTLRSSVNKGILRTIRTRPRKFFTYNNGIAVVAQNIECDDKGQLIKAKDFQIINGGQTTASLARAKYTDKLLLTEISVPMKLTVIKEGTDSVVVSDLIRNISSYSNTQNKIAGADLSSNHPLHVHIEKMAERIHVLATDGSFNDTYWYYERTRGSFEQKMLFMTRAQAKNFKQKYTSPVTGKVNRFVKSDLSKVHLLWNQQPHLVSKGSSIHFAKFMEPFLKDEEYYDQQKSKGAYEDNFYYKTVALLIMNRDLSDHISKCEWYKETSRGYRSQIVAYTMSNFARLFERKFGKDAFNWKKMFLDQQVQYSLLGNLLEMAKQITEKVLFSPVRKKGNVSEWAKMADCWEYLKNHFEFELTPFLEMYVLSKSEIKDVTDQAKTRASVSNELDHFEKVMNYQHWHEAYRFGYDNGELLTSELKVINKIKALQEHSSSLVPTDRELKLALAALEKIRKRGFDY